MVIGTDSRRNSLRILTIELRHESEVVVAERVLKVRSAILEVHAIRLTVGKDRAYANGSKAKSLDE